MIKNQELAETAIREARKTIDYNTVEYPLEYFIDKISKQQIVMEESIAGKKVFLMNGIKL